MALIGIWSAARIIELTVEIYKNPKGMVTELSALGLRLGLD